MAADGCKHHLPRKGRWDEERVGAAATDRAAQLRAPPACTMSVAATQPHGDNSEHTNNGDTLEEQSNNSEL